MSFLTDFTPWTPWVTRVAVPELAASATKPLSCTMPLKVSTLISADLRVGSCRIADFTLPVMTVSSKYSPVPSDLDVEAQPRAVAMASAAKAAEIRSEEHTSELQSQSNLVCRLLLEKKKKRDR